MFTYKYITKNSQRSIRQGGAFFPSAVKLALKAQEGRWQQICKLVAGSTMTLGKFKATGLGVICLTAIVIISLLKH